MATLQSIANVKELEDLLSQPTDGVIKTLDRLEGDIIVLGVAGKMGPTLARMARRASEAAGVRRRVIGVARFSDARQQTELQSHGVETIRCDLLDEATVAALPDAPNVVFMAGMKFGSTGQEALTWAMNCHLPAIICKRYPRSRIVAFSTGNVYGLTSAADGGSLETDAPNPVGDYAMSCLGRERIFEHFSRRLGIPMAMIRLNYACELRYGVLVDIARRVWSGETVDCAMGHLNTIWQTDANAMTLQAFDYVASPPLLLNVTGPEKLSVRDMATKFGVLMNKRVNVSGSESPTALLANAAQVLRLFGPPRVSVEQMLRWIADWVMRGGASLGKPTHFESRDGKF
ncbi:MAG: NAD-dependent epimerase/dehydratase family protein [Verrucomicrobia bacterium]|nr:NAD-dependent epimerase/dehydratase family protein [Verrucomicrobiota bacterium]